jgi:catechol 2,3-dioxygenase-like lactoylglutathione lyase family enzyme
VGAPPRGTPIDSTGNHYCVAVDDLDAAIAELDAQGIEYKRGVQGESNVQIWINDPAGNTIELQQDPATLPFSHGGGR